MRYTIEWWDLHGVPARMVAGSSVARGLLNYQNIWDIIKLQWVQGYGPGEEFQVLEDEDVQPSADMSGQI